MIFGFIVLTPCVIYLIHKVLNDKEKHGLEVVFEVLLYLMAWGSPVLTILNLEEGFIYIGIIVLLFWSIFLVGCIKRKFKLETRWYMLGGVLCILTFILLDLYRSTIK